MALLMFGMAPVVAAVCIFFVKEAIIRSGDMRFVAIILAWMMFIATAAVIGMGVSMWRDDS